MKHSFFKTTMTFLLTIIFVSCSTDTDIEHTIKNVKEDSKSDSNNIQFFRYGNQKIILTPDSSMFFVVNDTNNTFKENEFIREGNYNQYKNISIEITNADNFKWHIIDKHNFVTTRNQNSFSFSYYSPVYRLKETGVNIEISNLIHVKLKRIEDIDILNHQCIKYGLRIYSRNEQMPKWFTVACFNNDHGTVLDICENLYQTALFDIVEPDIMTNLSSDVSTFSKPNDTYFDKQWNLQGTYSINWPEASLLSTGKNIRIGLIDTGVDYTHPDFRSNNVHQVYDASISSWYVNQIYSDHGIACAGIMVAEPNNGKGIAGIASEAWLESISDPLTARPNASQNLASDLVIALNSYDIVSCSWCGSSLISSEIKDAINIHMPEGRNGKGTVLVFASGNENAPSVGFPGSYRSDILVVGASDKNGNKCDFSNYGIDLDVVAPGINIYTLGYNSKGYLDYNTNFKGTSAACPHVAAIAALILSANPNLTNIEVNDIIEKTCRKVGTYIYSANNTRPNGTWNMYMGYGLVDATAAVKMALQK